MIIENIRKIRIWILTNHAGTGSFPVSAALNLLKKRIIIILIFLTAISTMFSNKYQWDIVFFENNSFTFKAVDNADSMNIMALMGVYQAYWYIIKSTDAGINWKAVYYDTTFLVSKMVQPKDLAYPTKDFCISSADSNDYIKTTDGGITWKKYRIDTLIEQRGLEHISMFNDKHGIMASTHYMYISNDGFDTWKQVNLPGWYYILTIFMISPDILTYIAINYDGSPNYDEKFFKSTDGGNTWVEYPFPNFIFPFRIRFVDSLNGSIAGSDRIKGSIYADIIYKTTDGGESWWNMLDTICILPYGLQDLDMYDKDNGIAVGQAGKIYWTHNGWDTWERDSNVIVSYQTPPTMRVCMLGKNTALIADYNNRIMKSSLVELGVDEEISNPVLFRISPNPAMDFLEISYPPSINRMVNHTVDGIAIYNVFGQKVINLTPALSMLGEGVRIDVRSLSPGVYFLKIENKVCKFVKF